MGSAKIAVSLILFGGLGSALALPAAAAPAQEPAAQQQASASRLVGAITAIDGKSLTVKPDSGAPATVTISDTARILQTAPGAKTLAGATPIQLTDLAVGDRVLMAVHPSADGSAPIASTIIAVKQAAIAQEQKTEEADWQHRGVGGIVKTVDASAGTVTVAAGSRILTGPGITHPVDIPAARVLCLHDRLAAMTAAQAGHLDSTQLTVGQIRHVDVEILAGFTGASEDDLPVVRGGILDDNRDGWLGIGSQRSLQYCDGGQKRKQTEKNLPAGG